MRCSRCRLACLPSRAQAAGLCGTCQRSSAHADKITSVPAGGSGGKVIGLVGKGLTFDSGGYNLKVGGMIEQV